jgi:hypothetical protein
LAHNNRAPQQTAPHQQPIGEENMRRDVRHPRHYPRSSYRVNTEGQGERLDRRARPSSPARGGDDAARREAYRDKFRLRLEAAIVSALRMATNDGLSWAAHGFKSGSHAWQATKRPTTLSHLNAHRVV